MVGPTGAKDGVVDGEEVLEYVVGKNETVGANEGNTVGF